MSLSTQHTPDVSSEHDRIYAAGGSIVYGRIAGDLNVSRTLGDFSYKLREVPPSAQIVSCVPDVVVHDRVANDRFLVLATRSIFRAMEATECGAMVCSAARDGKTPQETASALVQHALERNVHANLSAIVVAFA